MRCISLWQPWASAIALGAKKVETRGWPVSFRGEIAIHAAKRWTVDERNAAFDLGDYCPELMGKLPLGAVLCIVKLVDCQPVERLAPTLSEQELAFGNYRSGEKRFGWLLEMVEVFPRPMPTRGEQGFWEWRRP